MFRFVISKYKAKEQRLRQGQEVAMFFNGAREGVMVFDVDKAFWKTDELFSKRNIAANTTHIKAWQAEYGFLCVDVE